MRTTQYSESMDYELGASTNVDAIAELTTALNDIKCLIHRHRTWTGMGWKQHHLGDFVANKIIKIIDNTIGEIDD